MPAYIASLGFSTDGVIIKTCQGAPMRHRGVQVGNFFLGEKQNGPEFTAEDEEMLVLFASQAATAVANARTHRDEQRARAALEALIETSPVGLLVFDVRSGRPVSINREARRLGEGVRTAGRPAEELGQVATCRFSYGREIVLGELPLPQVLGSARTMRTEEVVASVPDGRTVTVLANATPIRSDGGEVVSVIVTLQDLAPLQELERLRADFLGLVSHELRAPLAAIKGSAVTLLEDSAAFDPAERHEFYRLIAEQANHMRGLIGDLLDAGRIEAGTLSVAPEPSEVSALVDRARSTFLSGGGRHAVLVDLPAGLSPVMADRHRIVQVLNKLLSNAARHAPEPTPIRVADVREDAHVAVSVSDEGSGVAPERWPHLFRKYAHADAGGRAAAGISLGLTICKGLVEAHGGQGARFVEQLRGIGVGVGEARHFEVAAVPFPPVGACLDCSVHSNRNTIRDARPRPCVRGRRRGRRWEGSARGRRIGESTPSCRTRRASRAVLRARSGPDSWSWSALSRRSDHRADDHADDLPVLGVFIDHDGAVLGVLAARP